jgi:2-hydroxychromene-2-carboxylate isomerase
VLPAGARWRPVLARELAAGAAHEGFRCGEQEQIFRMEIERRACELALQPLRWPDPFPFDSALAMRVATYAASIGRAVAFAQAAFRQAFAGGRSLENDDSVLIAAAACELHPAAVLRAARTGSVARELGSAGAEARARGVREVPSVVIGDSVFAGERSLAAAAAAQRGARARGEAAR